MSLTNWTWQLEQAQREAKIKALNDPESVEFTYAVFDKLTDFNPLYRSETWQEANSEREKHQWLVLEVSNNFVIKECRIYKGQPFQWIPVDFTPEHGGPHLCFIEETQICGTVWKVQRVYTYDYAKWQVPDNVKVTHWMIVPEPVNPQSNG